MQELEGITTIGLVGVGILDLMIQEHSPPIAVFLS
jgi:hypothetical protein